MRAGPFATISFLALGAALMICLMGDLLPNPSTTLADFGYKWSSSSHISEIPARFRADR